jgi:flagellar L-ring protein precursor FlgH
MRNSMRALPLLLLLAACADEGFGARKAVDASLPHPAPPLTPEPAPPGQAATGSLFHPSRYIGLTSDRRARRVGDLITIRLTERTQASKAASAGSTRSSDNQITLPDAPPFSFVPPGLLAGGATQNFTGNGTAAQNNQLFGEITVTVAEVLPGGVLRVAGEKRLVLNRGEEQIQLTGLVRIDDLGPDNSLPSTRVADARILYAGTGQVADQGKQGWLARFFAKVSPL